MVVEIGRFAISGEQSIRNPPRVRRARATIPQQLSQWPTWRKHGGLSAKRSCKVVNKAELTTISTSRSRVARPRLSLSDEFIFRDTRKCNGQIKHTPTDYVWPVMIRQFSAFRYYVTDSPTEPFVHERFLILLYFSTSEKFSVLVIQYRFDYSVHL